MSTLCQSRSLDLRLTILSLDASSYPNPLAFFVHKRQQEARDRGEFIDIHDVGGVDPEDFDVLITDVNDEKLRSEIAEAVGIQYLAKATEADANNVLEIGQGIVYGKKLRTIFPCVVRNKDKAHWVFFVLDTGAPLTYLSAQASGLLGVREEQPTYLNVAGYRHPVFMSPTSSHFADINILGIDFCNACNISLWYDYDNQKVNLYFGGGWDPPTRKSKL